MIRVHSTNGGNIYNKPMTEWHNTNTMLKISSLMQFLVRDVRTTMELLYVFAGLKEYYLLKV